MSFSIAISEQAVGDILSIYNYIAKTLNAPTAAARQIDRLEDAISRLADIPEGFARYEEEPWHGRGLRRMPVDKYCVFYIANLKDEEVSVSRILYGGRNIQDELDANSASEGDSTR